MAAKKTLSDQTDNLRQRAEELAGKEEASAQEPLTTEQMQQMLHELKVHQIELEMQNEELRRTQHELDTARARYFDLYDLAPVAYLTLNEQGLIVEANLTAGTLLGMSRNTLLKQPLTRFIPPEDQDIYFLQRKHLVDSVKTQSWDMRIISPAGSTFWAHLQAIPAQNGECRITLEDITDRKLYEESLKKAHEELETGVAERTRELAHAMEQSRECEERHQLATSVAKEAIWEVDFATGTTWWNRAYAEIFNRPPEEHHHGKWWLHQIHPDDRERVYDKFSRAVAEGSDEWSDAYRMMRADGSYAFLQDRAIIVRDGAGNALRAVGAKQDITEQVKIEGALRESEERLHFALETCHTGAWDMNLADHHAFRSLEHDRIFGYPELLPEWTYEMFLEHVLPEDRKMVDDNFQQAMESRSDWNFECRIRRTDGQVRWVLAAGQHRLDAAGTPRRMTGIVQDISERKLAEEALRESEERLRFALEYSHTGAWEMNLVEHTAFHSLEHARIFGYPEALPNWTYKMFLEHVLPEDREMVDGNVRQAIENRRDWNFECRIRRTDGQVRWILTAGRHLYNSAGDPIRAAGIVQDITTRKQAEEEILQLNTELEKRVADRTADLALANEQLRQEIADRQQTENALRLANEKWLNTFNASSDPIFLLDTDHHIMRANKALAAMVGLPVKNIIGRLCHEIIHGSDAPATFCPQCMLLKDYQSHTSEIFLEKLNRYLLVTVSPIFDATNNLVGSIHYSKDITAIKGAEQVLSNAKSDLERMVTERTAELAQAHEQMKKVSFELIWAEEKERERIAAELHDQVGQSLLLAKMKLDALVDKLSDDSLHAYAVDASSLIGTSIQDIRSLTFRMRPPILDTAGIETALKWLCSSISNDYNLQVDFVDDGQPKPLSTELRYSLYQAVRELLLNVVKHAGTETAQLTVKSENHTLVVIVADNGVGFNRPDAIMKHVHNGGYGLYNVRQRIEQMGGRFDVESKPGRGTSVTLSVPLAES